jgi:hypothetical protein
MAERATVVQKTQIGVEAVPGTAVAASKQLLGLSIAPEPQVNSQQFRPQGAKFNTIVAEQREWMQAGLTGYPSFGDIIYPLSSVMSTAVVTQFMDGGTPTGGYKWVFDMNPYDLDTPKTFTVEWGGAARASRFSNAVVREFGLHVTRSTVENTGQIIGQRMQDGVTLTPAPTAVELVPMLASGWDVFMDPTLANIGTTKLGRLFDNTLTLNNRFGPIWPVDSSQTSYAAVVETVPALTYAMVVEADAAGMGYLSTLRQGSTVFARLRNIGPAIYSAGTYLATPLCYQATFDVALKVNTIGNFADNEGVYAVTFNFAGVIDTGWGKAMHAEIVNKTAVL